MDRVTASNMTVEPGVVGSRPAPDGLPDARIAPPQIAETGDPFSALRVIDAVARMDRGRPVRIDDLVDRLNATYLDWLFSRPVVVDALVTLQANWMADYRNASGIVLEGGPYGDTVMLEDSSRVDPWIVGQAQRAARECRDALDAFARRDRVAGD
jgi:hypothetical protein